MQWQRKRSQKRHLKQQGLRRSSINWSGGKLTYDCDNATWAIAMPDEPGSIVADLAKDAMPEEVVRLVQQFEGIGLPPTSVVYSPDDHDDAASDTAEGVEVKPTEVD